MKNVAWAVTGAGHYLAESVAAMEEISRENRVCTFVSRAGEEVARMYGLFDQLSEISGGEYLEELFLEREEGASSPNAGRFMMNKYDLLIIAPATANTVAKIVCGIADSLPTNAAALANKGGVPVYVLPTDIQDRAETEPPTPSTEISACDAISASLSRPAQRAPLGSRSIFRGATDAASVRTSAPTTP